MKKNRSMQVPSPLGAVLASFLSCRWAVPEVRQTGGAGLASVVVAISLAFGTAWAVNPPPAQIYYVPFPEDNQLTAFAAINSIATSPLGVFITLAVNSDNTVIYYDQWEDGYEEDILNPIQSTTQIWGDGNPANGYPPGNPGDLIPAGTVFSLRNFVDTTTLQTVFDYDARDKIAASKSISITKMTFPQSTKMLLAGCFEVFEYGLWGTEYRSPVGVNMTTGTDSDMFAYTSLAISAGPRGAHVQIDKDNNGSYEETVTLTEGQSVFRDAVNVGGHILSDQPVQVVLFAGRPGSNYQSRDSSLTPISRWGSSYYNPVTTPATAQTYPSGTVVFLYNPGASAITVTYAYRRSISAYTTATISVPAGSYAKTPTLINGEAYHFYTTGATPPNFYAFCAVNGSSLTVTDNQTWDGGFALISQPSLSTQVLLSLGIGRDPYSTTNPTQNGNPVYITTVGNGHTPATICVDYNGDNAGPLTDPNGNHYDVSYSLRELDQQKLFDPDGDQSGMMIYSLDETVKIAAVWAQDPTIASPAEPGVDVATIIPPLREGSAGKASNVVVDADGDGYRSAGDTLEYDIRVTNIARTPISGPFQVNVADQLPPDTTYVPGSTKYRISVSGSWTAWVAIPDDGSGTAFPLDSAGYSVPGSLGFGQSLQVVFQTVIDTYANLTPGTDRITNTGVVEISPYGVQILLDSSDLLHGSIGDRVWIDTDGDGVQDGGEGGLNGVIVWADLDNDNVRDADEPSATTAGNGDYVITGLLAGTYTVRVDPASVAAINNLYGPTYDLDGVATSYVATVALAAAQDRTDVDFGFRTGASVGDRVWMDRDADGVQENGEPGINGVRVYIDLNLNNVYDVGEPNSFTFGDGTYYIGNLTAGSYEVRVDTTTLPTGATQTYDLTAPTTDNKAAVTLTTVHNPLVDFGYRGTQSIGDLVWNDVDANGVNLNVIDGRVDINGSGGVDTNDDGYIGTMRVIDGYLDIVASGTITTADDGIFQGFTVIDGALDMDSSGTVTTADDSNRIFLPDIAIVDGLVNINASSGTPDANDDGYIGTMRVINGYLDMDGDGSGTTPDSGDDGTFQGYPVINGLVDTNRSGGISAADDGTLYTDKPIANVRVYIDMDGDGVFDATEPSATTNANGVYSIGNLVDGTYTVRVDTSTLPGSYAETYDLTPPYTDNTATVVLSGSSRTDVDFGYRDDASIGDSIWNDRDADGVQDAGEPGIAGVLVYLDANANAVYDAGERAALTDINGNYLITNLPAGTYSVRVEIGTLPLGSTQTYDLNGIGTPNVASRTLTAHENATNVDFGYRSTASIGDRVWTDTDADGVQDGGETGISGVRVFVDSNGNGDYESATEPSAVTDASGNYTIANLVAGTYTVRVETSTLPAGVVQTYDLTVPLDHTATVTLAANQVRTDVDFGYVASVSIGDRVWSDLDANGQQNAGEPGLDGVTVTVYRADDSIAGTTTTGGGGAYSFSNLLPGTYYVEFGTLPGYVRTLADQGADATDSDANVSTGLTANITLTAGQSNLTIDAGYYQPVAIGDFVFNDANADGVQDVGETGLAGVLVSAYRPGYGPDGIPGNGDDATAVATQTTIAGGAYNFTGLRPGTYQVGFGALAGYNRTLADQGADDTKDSDANAGTGLTGNHAVAAGTTDNTIDAGYYQPATIGNFVWTDTNVNGIQDVGETGLNGVTVNLYRPGYGPDGIPGNADDANVVATTTTAGGGIYSFTSLRPGSYTVHFAAPGAYARTLADQGADDTKDSDADRGTGLTGTYVLAAGATDNTVDAGFYSSALTGSIAGTVALGDGDGLYEPGTDTPLTNATVTLRYAGFDGILNTGDDTVYTPVVTGALGTYSFTGLLAGLYAVTETNPPGSQSLADRDGGDPDLITVTLDFGPDGIPGNGDDRLVWTTRDFEDRAPPTAVVVAEFAAGLVDGVPLIEWLTGSEVRTLGFNVYEVGVPGTAKRLVNQELIPSGGLRSGNLYVVPDSLVQAGETATYFLEEIEEQGAKRVYGPFKVVVPTVEALGIDPDASGTSRNDAAAAKASSSTLTTGVSAAATAAPATTSTGTRLRISVETPGLRYLSTAALAKALGAKASSVTTALTQGKVRLTCGGQVVGYVPVAGGAGLYFYGEASTSPYTKENVYWAELAAAGVTPTVTSGANPAPLANGFFTDVVHVEQNVRALLDAQGTDGEVLWVWQTVMPQNVVFKTFRGGFQLTDLAVTGGTATVDIRLIGGSDSASPADHVADYYVNGQLAGSSSWDGKVLHQVAITFPAAWLAEGYNELMIKGLPQPGVAASQFHVDAFDVAYPRNCLARGDLLEFSSDDNPVITIDGFSGAAVAVVDITNPQKPGSVSGLTIQASAAGFSASFMPMAPGRRYVAFLAAAVLPAQGKGVALKPLRTKSIKANYVVIVPEALASAAQPLATLRTAQKLLPKVVTFEAICDEFNDGRHEPEAIRRFLSYAWANWKTPPQYVVLAGSGSYDYRNYLNYGDCLLPTVMTWTGFGYAASDVSYGDVTGADDIPEIAVGRLPALSAAQLQTLVGKIVAYEGSLSLAWLYDAAFLSDTPDDSGDFPADAAALASVLAPSAKVIQISLGNTDLEVARGLVQQAFRSGSRLMVYLGHAGFDRLGRTGLLTSPDIPALANAPRFPVLLAGTCIVGDYSTPGRDCLAQQLLVRADGGCVAVWSPSILAYNDESKQMMAEILRLSQTSSAYRLGDAVRGAAAAYLLSEPGSEVGRMYNVLGDPATLLRKAAVAKKGRP